MEFKGPFIRQVNGTDPLKRGTVPMNVCKEISVLFWVLRRL